MAYVTVEYYRDVYKGLAVADTNLLERLIARSSDIIDQATGYKLVKKPTWLDNAFVAEQVKKATCAQVEFMALYGETSSATMIETPVMQVGKFRYGLLRGGKSEGGEKDGRAAQGAIAYLKPTGLLYSGIDTGNGDVVYLP